MGHVHVDLLLEVITTVHAFQDVLGDIEVITEGVADSDAIAIDLLDIEVSSLREELTRLELLWVPKRLASSCNFLGSGALLGAFLSAADGRAKNEGSGADEGLGDLGLRLGRASV